MLNNKKRKSAIDMAEENNKGKTPLDCREVEIIEIKAMKISTGCKINKELRDSISILN